MTNNDYRETLTPKQLSAVRLLEKAFKRCNEQGLSFVGMDDSIYCARTEDMDMTMQTTGYLVQQELSFMIDSAGYLDSGGW